MKTFTIALATAKETIRRPAFMVLALLPMALLAFSIIVPYFTFGEDIKVYKDTGLSAIPFFALILALLTASSSVADEIEGKTAITLLSKPINRRQFILGKYFGIEMSLLTLFAVLGVAFAIGVWFKYGYDIRESSGATLDALQRRKQIEQIFPGLVLGFCEISVLAAISVAISTRVPMLVNMIVCFSVFFMGHLTSILVATTKGKNELISFMAQLFKMVLPFLEFFNAGPSISTGAMIPWVHYVLPAAFYSVLYSGAAILLAFVLFEDRDLA